MIPDFKLCDICKEQTKQRVKVINGRMKDDLDGSYNTHGFVDLCPVHMEWLAQHLITNRLAGYSNQEMILRDIERAKIGNK